ncbi:hypothetical protein AX15_003513 [Amanita polypyramis BW_CC]|nr:hypothetical protein AX15_003513 [Amanita polypyramis BW_CC]
MGSAGKINATMQRVLFIPELLDMIFSYLGLSDNAANARVCKRWCEVALDTLWREVEDMHRLCSVLAPLYVADTSEYKFSRPPESSDWKRFERYSGRVRRLRYRPGNSHCPISQSVFDDIARTRTSLAILPNMHTLEWEGSLTLCVMFMHSNIRRFAIRLPHVMDLTSVDTSLASDISQVSLSPKSSSILRPFFADVIDRMPNLTHLNIKMNFAISRVESEVAELIRGLKKLKKFAAPRYCVTTDIMDVLSKLEFLGCVEFQYSDDQGCGDPEDVSEFTPTVEEGVFPSLWDLGLAVCYDDFTRFINAPFAPTNLRMVYLDSQFFETPEGIKSLLVALSENCQLLQSLALLSRVDVMNGIQGIDPADEQCITFDILKPLLNCPNLTSFELVHGCPVVVTQDEIEELAEKWPSLETLLLNNEPGFINDARLTLDALLPFARHCPRLRHLGMFINASTVGQTYNSTPTRRSREPRYAPIFKSLRKLSMGVSPVSDINGVTLFLSSICPADCLVESGVTWDEKLYVPADVVRAIKVRCERWARVEEMLPGMVELRLQERAWSKEVEKENEDLKIRNSILLGKLGLTPTSKAADDSCITA